MNTNHLETQIIYQVLKKLYDIDNWPDITTPRMYRYSHRNIKYYEKLCDKFGNIKYDSTNKLYQIISKLNELCIGNRTVLYQYVDLKGYNIHFGINYKNTITKLVCTDINDLVKNTTPSYNTVDFYIDKIYRKLIK
jgi:hypothetical protein